MVSSYLEPTTGLKICFSKIENKEFNNSFEGKHGRFFVSKDRMPTTLNAFSISGKPQLRSGQIFSFFSMTTEAMETVTSKASESKSSCKLGSCKRLSIG